MIIFYREQRFTGKYHIKRKKIQIFGDIYKIDVTEMKIIKVYPSIAEAARQNNIIHAATLNRWIKNQVINNNILFSRVKPEDLVLKKKFRI